MTGFLVVAIQSNWPCKIANLTSHMQVKLQGELAETTRHAQASHVSAEWRSRSDCMTTWCDIAFFTVQYVDAIL